VTSTRAKLGEDRTIGLPWTPRSRCRHVYSRPLLIACLRATAVGVVPGSKLSKTISRFCSGVQIRRRSPRVINSMRGRRALLRPIV
jgi:hypothetical protein